MEWPRLYVLGTTDTERTSLVKTLLGDDFTEQGSPLSSPSRSSSPSSLYSSSSSSTFSSSSQVNVHRWKPREEASLALNVALDVWDIPTSHSQRGAHLLYMTRPCTVLIVAGGQHVQLSEVLDILSGVVNKFPDVQILVALTAGEEGQGSNSEDTGKTANILSQRIRHWLENRKTALLEHIEGIKSTVATALASEPPVKRKHQPDEQTLISQLTGQAQKEITANIRVSRDVLIENLNTQEGVPHLRQEILKSLTGKGLQAETPQLPPPLSTLSVYGVILEMTELGLVLLPKTEFSTILRDKLKSVCAQEWKETHLKAVMQHLISSGQILKFPLIKELRDLTSEPPPNTARASTPNRPGSAAKRDKNTKDGGLPTHSKQAEGYICVDLESFANMIGACIIDDTKKTFRFEASQFWPPESGFQAPDPSSLARVLEEIPGQGVIREAVLPLLWQEFELESAQIDHCVSLFQHLGVFSDHHTAHSDIAGLAMPDFLSLSAVQGYRFTLLDVMPSTKPQLNWTTRPYKGDLQVCWRLLALTTSPPGSVMRRALAVLRWSARQDCLYSHMWRDGLLIKLDEEMTPRAYGRRPN